MSYTTYKNTTIPEYESVTGSKLIFSDDKIYIYELNHYGYEKYLNTIFPISQPVFKYGGGSILFFGEYKLVMELSPEEDKIAISYVHAEGHKVNIDEENAILQAINNYFVSATLTSDRNSIISKMENLLTKRIDISNRITDVLYAIDNLMGQAYDISTPYRQWLYKQKSIIDEYQELCNILESLANEIETFSITEKNNHYVTYLANNTNHYYTIIRTCSNEGCDKRLKALESLLNTYKTLQYTRSIGAYGEDIGTMVNLIGSDINIITNYKTLNSKFVLHLKRIVNKVNQLVLA